MSDVAGVEYVTEEAPVAEEAPPVEAPVEAAEGDAPYWPDDWREKLAEHAGAGDEKAVARELKRLDRYADPTSIYGKARELESKFSGGGLVKVPGPDADEKDLEDYRKAMGVPDKPDDYFNSLELSDSTVIGDADKEAISYYAQIAHESGLPPASFNKLVQGYYQSQEQQASATDDADYGFRRESTEDLREEYGDALPRYTRAIGEMFTDAPGGTDLENGSGLMNRLLGGRMADGHLIGDDPDMVRWLINRTRELHPYQTVTEGGAESSQTVENELAEIRNIMKTDRRRYNTEFADRYKELLDAQTKDRALGRG
jgi:hypothetical protein